MMRIHWMKFFVAAVVAALLCSNASAGTILATPAPVPSGPGLGFATVAAVVTVQANNDNVPSPNFLDNNVTVPLKRFDNPGYIDIEFTVAPSDGVTEYQVSEFVDNNTGLPWSQYNMVLGFGTGAGFVVSPLGDGLDFDFPTYDTPPNSAAFPTVLTPDEDQLVFTGGIHGAGAQPYVLRIDVPDLSSRTNRFTLRQWPTAIPEPSSIALIVLGAVYFALRRRA
jgi:PEP-CTERM motif